jgi:hypothetical protein
MKMKDFIFFCIFVIYLSLKAHFLYGWDRVKVDVKAWCGRVPTSTCPQARLYLHGLVIEKSNFCFWKIS